MKQRLLTSVLFISICGAQLFADSFDDNLAKILSQTGHQVKIIASKRLVDMNDMRIVNVEFSNATGAQRTPFLATADGKGAIIFSNLFFNSNQKANDPIIEAMLADIDAFNESKKNSQLNALFKSMPEDMFVTLPATKQGVSKTTVIVSSPDCPYCREELSKIEQRLEESNVKMLIVPLNAPESYVRAQILVNELKNAKTLNEKIATLRKIYAQDYVVPREQKNIDTSFVTKTADLVFKTGLIRGVPYVHIMD